MHEICSEALIDTMQRRQDRLGSDWHIVSAACFIIDGKPWEGTRHPDARNAFSLASAVAIMVAQGEDLQG